MMKNWTLLPCIVFVVLLSACTHPSNQERARKAPVAITPAEEQQSSRENPMVEDLGTIQELDLEALAAENNRLFEELQANTPIQVAPANASARTLNLIMPTLF